jgi:aminoglycoside phosphotransferase (APT) family kinase protein
MPERLKRPIPAASIRQIVKHHFGGDAKVALTSMTRGGLFNTIYEIRLGDGRTVVLRIAPPQDKPPLGCEVGLLQREIHFTRTLQKYHLPIPKILGADLSKRVIDRNYIITEHCPGYNAFYRLNMLTPPQQDAVFGELGRYARQIHAIENPAGWFGAPPPLKPFRKWSAFVRWHGLTLLQELQGQSYMAIPRSLGVPSILDKMRETLDEIKTPRLVHGDLWLRNILITRREGTYKSRRFSTGTAVSGATRISNGSSTASTCAPRFGKSTAPSTPTPALTRSGNCSTKPSAASKRPWKTASISTRESKPCRC